MRCLRFLSQPQKILCLAFLEPRQGEPTGSILSPGPKPRAGQACSESFCWRDSVHTRRGRCPASFVCRLGPSILVSQKTRLFRPALPGNFGNNT